MEDYKLYIVEAFDHCGGADVSAWFYNDIACRYASKVLHLFAYIRISMRQYTTFEDMMEAYNNIEHLV